MCHCWQTASPLDPLTSRVPPFQQLVPYESSTGYEFLLSVCHNSPTWAPPFLRFLDHTQWHTTVRGTTLGGPSTHRRDHYLTTQHSQDTDILAPDRIRTRNPNKRAAADPRLRQLGHWDRLTFSPLHKYSRRSLSKTHCFKTLCLFFHIHNSFLYGELLNVV